MRYSIKQLASLSGVSSRTLRWYDETGLLKPERCAENDYRVYSEAEADRLQEILFYRELGLALSEIKKLLCQHSENRADSLRRYKNELLLKREQVNRLLLSVDKTILAEEGKYNMNTKEKFEAFKKDLVDINEAQYGAQVRGKFGDDTMNEANAKMMNLSKTAYDEMQTLSNDIIAALKSALESNCAPNGEQGKKIAAMHKEWLLYTWKSYSKKAHCGLGETYIADERFTAYYDNAAGGGAAQFLCSAIAAFCA